MRLSPPQPINFSPQSRLAAERLSEWTRHQAVETSPGNRGFADGFHRIFKNAPRLLSVPQLADLVGSFSSHQDRNARPLATIGRPGTKFSPNWISDTLGYLYPRRTPAIRSPWERPDAILYLFDWTSGDLPDWSPQDLSKEHAIRLNELRPKVLVVRKKIIRLLKGSVRQQRTKGLRESALGILVDGGVLAEEADFLLQVDALYYGFDLVEEKRVRRGGWRPGGLIDLLEVIGWCDEELNVGFWARTREALGDIPINSDGQPGISERDCAAARISPNRARFDDAIECFWRLLPQYTEFWTQYADRVSDVIENELRVPWRPEMLFSRRAMLALQSQLPAYPGRIEAHVAETGKLPIVRISSPTPPARAPSASLLAPPGTRWADIEMTVLADGNAIVVKIGGAEASTYEPQKLGMAQLRNSSLPTASWRLLIQFAKQGRIVLLNDDSHSRTSKRVERLRTDLRLAFGITEESVISRRPSAPGKLRPHGSRGFYEPKFKIRHAGARASEPPR